MYIHYMYSTCTCTCTLYIHVVAGNFPVGKILNESCCCLQKIHKQQYPQKFSNAKTSQQTHVPGKCSNCHHYI